MQRTPPPPRHTSPESFLSGTQFRAYSAHVRPMPVDGGHASTHGKREPASTADDNANENGSTTANGANDNAPPPNTDGDGSGDGDAKEVPLLAPVSDGSDGERPQSDTPPPNGGGISARGGVDVGWSIRLLYFFLAFAQELPTTSISLILVQTLSVAPSTLYSYYTIIFVPWTIKPVYGFISDHFPWFGYRRRPYLILAGLTSAALLVLLGTPLCTTSYTLFVLVSLCRSVAAAFSQTALDSVTIQWANQLYRSMHAPTTPTVAAAPAVASDTPTPLPDKFQSTASEAPVSPPAASDESTVGYQQLELSLNPERAEAAAVAAGGSSSTSISTGGDGNITRLTHPELMSRVQSSVMISRTLASVISSGLAIVMATFCSPAVIVSLSGVFSLAGMIPAWYVPDTKLESAVPTTAAAATAGARGCCSGFALHRAGASTLLSRYWTAIKVLYRPCIFLFVYSCTPSAGDAYLSFIYSQYWQFQDWEWNLFNFIGLSGSLLGILIYSRISQSTTATVSPKPSTPQSVTATTKLVSDPLPSKANAGSSSAGATASTAQVVVVAARSIRTLFVVTTLVSVCVDVSYLIPTYAPNNFNPFGIPVVVWVPVLGFVTAVFDRIALMPSVVLAAQSCPPDGGLELEGTMYSVFSSISDLGTLVSTAVSGRLTARMDINYDSWSNLWVFLLICNACALIPLVLVPILPLSTAATKSPAEQPARSADDAPT